MFFGFLHLNNRFNQVEEAIVASENSIPADTIAQEAPNSTNIRFHLWKNAVQLISRNPLFGVGTGDIKEELVNIYTENNYAYGIRERISPHNQFLHTGVILGITGMVLLAIYFFYPLCFSFKEKDWLYFFFLTIILLNAMTESILEREAGILFFTAFNTCFYLQQRFRNSIS
jgi:O-antigen ligase